MAQSVSPIYSGILIFSDISKAIGLPVDQLNVIIFQLLAIPLGLVLRYSLPKEQKQWRYIFCLVAGLCMMWALIRWQILVALVQVFISYLMMKFLPPTQQQIPVLIFCLGYMLLASVWRITLPLDLLCYDGSYPLMTTTQKITSLAFSISDWRLDKEKMSQDRRKWAVRQVPSFLEYFSYVLSYQGVLAGPFCHFRVFKVFIEGDQRDKSKEDNDIEVHCLDGGNSYKEVFLKKMIALICWAFLAIAIKPYFPDNTNIDPEFIANNNVFLRVAFLYVCLFLTRAKYYVTWTLADMIYNASGMGYLGVDSQGHHDWSGMTNVNVWKIETATNLKVFIENWNILTTQWLRHVCYSRVPYHATFFTFLLSAAWHGLHFGYYLTFVFTSFAVLAGRKVRRTIRPLFQHSRLHRSLYDLITLIGTHVSISLLMVSFVLLEMGSCIKFENSFFWMSKLIFVLVFVVLPSKKTEKKNDLPEATSKNQNCQNNNIGKSQTTTEVLS